MHAIPPASSTMAIEGAGSDQLNVKNCFQNGKQSSHTHLVQVSICLHRHEHAWLPPPLRIPLPPHGPRRAVFP